MFAAIVFAAQVVVADRNGFLRSEVPAVENGYFWRRTELEGRLCSIGYFEGDFVDFSVMSTRIGLSLSIRFREGDEWYQGEDWLDPDNRIFLRQIVFERGPEDEEDYLSSYDVDTSSIQSPLEQGYTARISAAAAIRALPRDRSYTRMTVDESDFLRRLDTSDHLTIIAEDAQGQAWTYRLEIPEDIGPQIAWTRECAERFPKSGEDRERG